MKFLGQVGVQNNWTTFFVLLICPNSKWNWEREKERERERERERETRISSLKNVNGLKVYMAKGTQIKTW